jgi:hypothetical protein
MPEAMNCSGHFLCRVNFDLKRYELALRTAFAGFLAFLFEFFATLLFAFHRHNLIVVKLNSEAWWQRDRCLYFHPYLD